MPAPMRATPLVSSSTSGHATEGLEFERQSPAPINSGGHSKFKRGLPSPAAGAYRILLPQKHSPFSSARLLLNPRAGSPQMLKWDFSEARRPPTLFAALLLAVLGWGGPSSDQGRSAVLHGGAEPRFRSHPSKT